MTIGYVCVSVCVCVCMCMYVYTHLALDMTHPLLTFSHTLTHTQTHTQARHPQAGPLVAVDENVGDAFLGIQLTGIDWQRQVCRNNVVVIDFRLARVCVCHVCGCMCVQ